MSNKQFPINDLQKREEYEPDKIMNFIFALLIPPMPLQESARLGKRSVSILN
jgi:hypothetical protein